ncbi:MAG: hypothetical protein ACRDZX_02020, partial [Acidimicrobiales bacterium]
MSTSAHLSSARALCPCRADRVPGQNYLPGEERAGQSTPQGGPPGRHPSSGAGQPGEIVAVSGRTKKVDVLVGPDLPALGHVTRQHWQARSEWGTVWG